MTKPQEGRVHDDFLVRIARFHCLNAWRSACLLLSVSFAGVGALLLLYPVYGAIQRGGSLILGDLALGIFGVMGVFAGWLIRVFSCLSRVAHEVLLRLDDDYGNAHGTEVEGQQETATPKCADAESSFQSPSKSWLRELSTRDLRAGWRLLVMVPLVVGVTLLLSAIGAWQIPSLDTVFRQCGVRLEYLCIAGILCMVIGGYLMLLGGIVSRQAHDANRANR